LNTKKVQIIKTAYLQCLHKIGAYGILHENSKSTTNTLQWNNDQPLFAQHVSNLGAIVIQEHLGHTPTCDIWCLFRKWNGPGTMFSPAATWEISTLVLGRLNVIIDRLNVISSGSVVYMKIDAKVCFLGLHPIHMRTHTLRIKQANACSHIISGTSYFVSD
jgi:hypothetical protein